MSVQFSDEPVEKIRFIFFIEIEPGFKSSIVRNELKDYLDFAMRHADTSLISDRARQQCLELAAELPVELASSLVLLECRLDSTSEQIDIGFGQHASPENRNLISTWSLPTSSPASHHWHKAQQFLQRIRSDSPLLWNAIDNTWLEFDANQIIPSFFCRILAEDHDNYVDLIRIFIRNLSPSEIADALLQRLDALFKQLGNELIFPYIGWMFSRGNKLLKLLIPCTDIATAIRKLELLDLHDASRSAARILKPFEKLADYVILSIDVGAHISERIGIEIYRFSSLEQPNTRTMLDLLVEQQLCTQEKKEALEAWPGTEWISQSPEQWPEDLRKIYFGSFASRQFFSLRYINHIKVLFSPDTPPMAKAYIASSYGCKDRNKELRPFTMTEMNNYIATSP